MHTRNSFFALALLLVFAWPCAADAKGSVYKWVDEEGNVHYTSTPPPDQKAEDTGIRNDTTKSDEPAEDNRQNAAAGNDSKAPRVNVGQRCAQARKNVNRGVDEWLESAKEGLSRGNTQERHDKGVAEFERFRTGINRQLASCPSTYGRDEGYRKMVDCLANLAHPSNFMSCDPTE